MKRRDFVKTAVLASASLAVGIRSHAAEEKPAAAPKLPQRPYGKTGVKLSIIGFPGLVLSRVGQDEANRLVAESVERGVNYFDVGPSYGNAVDVLGPALEPHRKDCFLACKTLERAREGELRTLGDLVRLQAAPPPKLPRRRAQGAVASRRSGNA